MEPEWTGPHLIYAERSWKMLLRNILRKFRAENIFRCKEHKKFDRRENNDGKTCWLKMDFEHSHYNNLELDWTFQISHLLAFHPYFLNVLEYFIYHSIMDLILSILQVLIWLHSESSTLKCWNGLFFLSPTLHLLDNSFWWCWGIYYSTKY